MPTEGKMMDNGDISMGTTYSLNQEAYNMVFPYNDEDITNHLKEISEWLYTKRCNYAMLLCNERHDYTVFNYFEKSKNTYNHGTMSDLRDCLKNRGKVLDVRYLEDQDAWEIWIRFSDGDEYQNHMFMFFDCESFVIEV